MLIIYDITNEQWLELLYGFSNLAIKHYAHEDEELFLLLWLQGGDSQENPAFNKCADNVDAKSKLNVKVDFSQLSIADNTD